MKDMSDVVEKSVEHFALASDRLAKLVQVATGKLEKQLAEQGIPARVSGRVKNPESLRGKLQKWAADPEKAERITSPEQVLSEVGDLAAVRVMTYLEKDRPKVVELVKNSFRGREGYVDFEIDVKEEDSRISQNPRNHYRATHMQIRLREDDLRGENANLKNDHCELQVTSMLAHVWNEIEHDTVYKTLHGDLSDEEKTAIDSLGLLTKTGDNIVESLLYARRVREERHKRSFAIENARFSTPEALLEFLQSHFGDHLAKFKMDYTSGTKEFLSVLRAMEMDHPDEVARNFSPRLMLEARKEALRLRTYQTKTNRLRPACKPDTCDLFLMAAYILDDATLAEKFSGLHQNKREVAFLNLFREMRG